MKNLHCRFWHTNNSLQLASNRLILDIKVLPGQNNGFDFQFNLQGELLVYRESSSVLESERTPSVRGWVTMGLDANLPLPFSLMQDYIVLPVGNGILDQLLGAMDRELSSRIIMDYNIWCHVSTQLTGTVPQLSAPWVFNFSKFWVWTYQNVSLFVILVNIMYVNQMLIEVKSFLYLWIREQSRSKYIEVKILVSPMNNTDTSQVNVFDIKKLNDMAFGVLVMFLCFPFNATIALAFLYL